MNEELKTIAQRFDIRGTVANITPMGNGLINDTYRVNTLEDDVPDYVLQRVNNAIFTDVDLLQDNIQRVTGHIKKKLEARGESDIQRKVLEFIPAIGENKTYVQEDNGTFWRMMVLIPDAYTHEQVNPTYSYEAGKAFGLFESMLIDLPGTLGETIPNFHNMELRAQQLQEAVAADKVGRLPEVAKLVEAIRHDMEEMCRAERLFAAGKLPKRVCHCDTKVNNMLFDAEGNVLCVIDLDTVMPAFIFSDYGDFLRTAANKVPEDHPVITEVAFRFDIFEAFTKGYLDGTKSFLTDMERIMLPYAVALFPFMQCVRFLTDYLNGDVYYKTTYPTHNLVRARNQWALYQDVRKHEARMQSFIDGRTE